MWLLLPGHQPSGAPPAPPYQMVTTKLREVFDKAVEDLREAARIRLNKIAGR